nr:FAD-binding oxygenase [Nocardiopsis sp.]
MMLGLLLARAGVDVTVLEKHADFFNDFRGDTVHPSTLQVLEDIGLGEEVNRIPHRKVRKVTVGSEHAGTIEADLGSVPGSHPYISMIPQWDFLDMLAREARRYPNFRLLMNATSTLLLRKGDAVRGVEYTDPEGTHRLRSVLTVSADGRNSRLREFAGLRPRRLGSPMDVLWLRVSRASEQVEGLNGRTGEGTMAFAIDRGDYWQIAYVIRKGGFDALRREPVERLQERLRELLPFLGDRVSEVSDWEKVALLNVGLDRLERWYTPGYLCIGDAAHAMTPVGGVGINLAVQDAVAAANILAGPLSRAQRHPDRFERTFNPEFLARVQRRRWFPDTGTQRVQQFIQRELFGQVIPRPESEPDASAPGSSAPDSSLTRAVLSSETGSKAATWLYSRIITRVMMRGLRPETVTSPSRPELVVP